MMLDAKYVKLGPDGKVYVFNNGIMNTEQQALDNAATPDQIAQLTTDTANRVTSKGLLSSKTITTRASSTSTTAVASNLEGQSVSISAGQDLGVKGSNVLADQDVSLKAGGNVTLEAAQNTQSQTNYRQETKSGLMSGGGIGFTVGKRQQSLDQQGQSTSAAQSTIGAINGNVTINAGGAYTQTGSDVLTPKGDIDITAKTVTITEARETGSVMSECPQHLPHRISTPRFFKSRSCPSVRNTFPIEFQPQFFQIPASWGWFLMAWLGLWVLRSACFLRKCWHLRRLLPCPVRTVVIEVF